LVNYSDLYNDYFRYFLNNKKKIGKIQKIEITFQKKLQLYKDSYPILDFLPHFFAIANKLIVTNGNFFLIKNKFFKKDKYIYQNIIFSFKNKKNQIIKFNYSNNSSKNKRKIVIHGTKGIFNYDAYDDSKNFFKIKNKIFLKNILKKKINSPIQNILNYMYYLICNRKFFSDLPLSIKIQKMTDKLLKKF